MPLLSLKIHYKHFFMSGLKLSPTIAALWSVWSACLVKVLVRKLFVPEVIAIFFFVFNAQRTCHDVFLSVKLQPRMVIEPYLLEMPIFIPKNFWWVPPCFSREAGPIFGVCQCDLNR